MHLENLSTDIGHFLQKSELFVIAGIAKKSLKNTMCGNTPRSLYASILLLYILFFDFDTESSDSVEQIDQ